MKRNAVAWAALVVSTAALISSRGMSRPMPAGPAIPAEGQKAARALSEAFEAVADFARPSVVQISVQHKGGIARTPGRGGQNPFAPFFRDPRGGDIDPKDFQDMLKKFFGPDFKFEKEQFIPMPRGQGTGSGFVYDDKGHILTNNHVVDGAGKITVTFHDGVEATATVVGTDPKSDVAVIKVDNTGYRPLPRGSSGKLKVGELVMAVGSPFGLSQSVTTGIISATDRNDLGINGVRDAFESFLQTDAPINPGNSGGPLVNMDGQAVGVNSAIMTGGRGNDGVGFAIPIDLASSIADKLIKDGKVSRARIGLQLQALSPATARQLGLDPKTKGILVGDVVPGSPAEKAGLKTGDVITGFNGQPIASLPAFRMTVAASDVGKSFGLTYFRDGKEHTTKVVPAPADKVVFAQEKEETPDEPEVAKAESPKTTIDDFGLEVQPLTPELAKSLGFEANLSGLLVSSVKDGSPADAAGLKEGVVITKVVKDQKLQPVKTVKEFQDLAAKADDLTLYVQTTKGSLFVTLSKAK
jgi:serine protease Do